MRMANTIVLQGKFWIYHWHNVKKHCFCIIWQNRKCILKEESKGECPAIELFSCVISHDKVSQRGRPIISFFKKPQSDLTKPFLKW